MAGGARKEETMKKLMALVTALLLICTLAACGGAPLKKPSEQDTLALLRQADARGDLHFIGNIEAKEAIKGGCDVIVADGFSGNVLLKSIEGTGKLLSIKLKEMLMHSTGTKLAALLLKGQLADFKRMLDANEVGGTALLGISKPVVKAHGSASEVGICNAVRQAMEVARSGIIDDIAQNIDKMRIEQKAE